MKDGKPAIILKEFWQDPKYFADVFNGYFFDGLGYLKECETFATESCNRKQTSAEFLSKMCTEDRLHPIFTLTIYYGEDPWDGPFALRDMMVDMPESMEKRFSDYKMNLLQIRDSGDYTFHHGDVELAFGIAKELLAGNMKDLEHKYGNELLTSSVRKFIGAVASVPEFLETQKDEEEISMCRAMDAYREEILEQGIERGMQRGMKRGIERSIFQLRKKDFNAIQISELLNLEEDYVTNVLAKMAQ